MRVSLVTATFNRTDCLVELLESLQAQSFQDFELIMVDQNADDRVVPVLAPFIDHMNITHLRSDIRKLSHARNLGIARCTGDIVGFPDDDCTYPPNVLSRVVAAFEADADLGVLSGPSLSPSGGQGSGRWQAASGPITLHNVWTSVIAFNFFIRRPLLQRVGGFDELLGVGARFGSAEETDLAIRAIRLGARAMFDIALNVVHPDKRLTDEAAKRAFSYGTGLGRVLRKHPAPVRVAASFFVRPLGGLAVSLMRSRALPARYYWRTFQGRLSGYLAR